MAKTKQALLMLATLSILAALLYSLAPGLPATANAALETSEREIRPAEAIARLHRLYSVFTETREREGLTLAQRKAVETEFLALLAKVPMSLLSTQMEKYEVAFDNQIASFEQPRQFVQRLATAAMNGIITPINEVQPLYGELRFSNQINGPLGNEFGFGEKSIVAYFDSSGYSDETILIRWYETGSGKMILFKQFSITDNPTNYVWIHDDEGQPPGIYRVEVFRVNEALDLLSSGSYRVADG